MEALPLQVDVRDERQIDEMTARTLECFGRIDVLVNNAGALHWHPAASKGPNMSG